MRLINFRIRYRQKGGKVLSRIYSLAELIDGAGQPCLGLEEVVSKDQGTERFDQSGKQIFEHDVVKKGDVLYEVVWDDAFVLKPPGRVKELDIDFLSNYNSEDFEIIGNSHDHPELIKKRRKEKAKK